MNGNTNSNKQNRQYNHNRQSRQNPQYRYPEPPDRYSRGQIWYVTGGETTGSEMHANRPAVIVGNNLGNDYSSVVEVVYLTRHSDWDFVTHVPIHSCKHPSVAVCEQPTPVSVTRLTRYMGTVTRNEMARIEDAMSIAFNLKPAEYRFRDNQMNIRVGKYRKNAPENMRKKQY